MLSARGIYDPEELGRRLPAAWARLLTTGRQTGACRLPDQDGSARDIRCSVTANVTPARRVAVLRGISEVRERMLVERAVRRHAERDPLTDLYNRAFFERELHEVLQGCGDTTGGRIIALDVDHLKVVNGSLGHRAGDELLRDVAQAMRDAVRQTDLLARLGGDDFAILLPGASEADADAVAARVLQGIRTVARRFSCTASAGIAALGGQGARTAAQALVGADLALLRAKEAGRDRVVRHDGRGDARLVWVDRVRQALRESRFVLHAQPIVALPSATTVSHELLVRMLDPTGAVIPPAKFLPVAERFGLIREIDDWVIAEGLRLAATGVPVSINLSPRSIADADTLPHISRQLACSGADAADVQFEITETAAIGDLCDARAFVRSLRDLGCAVALDDFGAGFAGLAYLKHLPVSHVKIDMEFVRNVCSSEADQHIVTAIVAMARGLGVKTVAEGVEDAATAEALAVRGVDLAQGYHFGRPAPHRGAS